MPTPKLENLIRLSTFAKSYIKRDGTKGCSIAYLDKLDLNIYKLDGRAYIDKTAPYNIDKTKPFV